MKPTRPPSPQEAEASQKSAGSHAEAGTAARAQRSAIYDGRVCDGVSAEAHGTSGKREREGRCIDDERAGPKETPDEASHDDQNCCGDAKRSSGCKIRASKNHQDERY